MDTVPRDAIYTFVSSTRLPTWMNEAALIYPHQLFDQAPVLARGRPVFLVEEPLILSHNPVHRARLVLHKRTMDAYQERLETVGHSVRRLAIGDHPQTADVFARLRAEGFGRLHIADTHDDFLEQAITDSGLARVWYETPQFLLSRAEAEQRYLHSRRSMAPFEHEVSEQPHEELVLLSVISLGPISGSCLLSQSLHVARSRHRLTNILHPGE